MQINKTKIKDPSSNLLTQAMRTFASIYEERNIQQSREHIEAIMRSFIMFDDICSKELTERYVLSLPTGSGKTTAIVAWCSAIEQSDIGYSVAIASAQVQELFNIRKQLIEAGVSPNKIGILYSDRNENAKEYKRISPSAKNPHSYQFLLVTHARYACNHNKADYRNYKGQERNIVFWDETFRGITTTNYNAKDILKDLYGVQAMLNIEPDEHGCEINRFIKEVTQAIRVQLNEFSSLCSLNTDLKVRDASKRSNILGYLKGEVMSTETYDFCVHYLDEGITFLLKDNIMAMSQIVPEDLKPMVVLDASYAIDGISQLDSSLLSSGINYKQSYPHLHITHRPCSSGRISVNKILNNTDKRTDLIDMVLEELNNRPEDEAILIITYKQHEDLIKKELSKAGVDLNITISSGKPKYNFLTWGREKASNDFIHCQHLINIGCLDIGGDNIEAYANAVTGGDYMNYPNDRPIGFNDLMAMDYAQRIYQAISRLAIRLPNFKGKCTVTLLVHSDDYLNHLINVFPEAVIKIGEAVFQQSKTQTDRVFKLMQEVLDGLPSHVNSILSKDLYELIRSRGEESSLSVTKQTLRGARKRMIDQARISYQEWTFENRTVKRCTLFNSYN